MPVSIPNIHVAPQNGMKTVCAVALLRPGDGACVLQHRDEKPGLPASGLWVMPGGHLGEGEDPHDCACRELEEETGYHTTELGWLNTVYEIYDPELTPYALMLFWGVYDGHQKIQCFEGQEMKFVRRNETKGMKIPRYQKALWDLAASALDRHFGKPQWLPEHEAL